MWKRIDQYLREQALNIRREKELDMNRRGFVAASLGFLGVLFLSSFPFTARALRPEHKETMPAVRIAGLNELKVGESKPFLYPHEKEPALLIRLSDNKYRSYHIKCTHLGCPVYWDNNTGKMTCPCHNGFFNVEDGSVLAGPPQRALPAVKLDFRSDGIYAIGLVPIEGHQGV
jgi:arsenite oxidase small subunit